ncbi:MAG: TraB/GumN family protein, partial [Brevundimonas sp.]|nr:TraB/GumN family protein [Brevundimonas sp.]
AVAAAVAAPVAVLPATGAGPALWVVKDADSTLYLFGTVHVLKPTTAWGSAKVDDAFAAASDIYFEISNPDDQAAMMPLIQQYGVSPQTPLSSLLTPAEIADLDAAAKTIGASAAQLDVFRPWLAGLSLSMAPLVKAGYDPASGVELTLKARAQAAGKPIHGFETIDEQVRVLATLPEETQLEFLRSTLHSFDDAATELDGLVGAWAAGDVATLQKLGVDDMKLEAPAIYEALLTRRNAGFADDIQGLLAGSGVAFIAVGAAHLAGPDSVQAMLETRGVTVEQQ